MDKAYTRIIWENEPSVDTPLNAENLNKMDIALNEIDNRVVSLDSSKSNKVNTDLDVRSITLNESTGVITVTKANGDTSTLSVGSNRVVTNYAFDANPNSAHYKSIVLTLKDGTTEYINLSSFISVSDVTDSSTIAFDTTNGFSANIKDGSITGTKLQTDYLANAQAAANNASASATSASGFATTATDQATLARSYAVGGTGTRPGEDTDNAKYYKEQAAAVVGTTGHIIQDSAGTTFTPRTNLKFMNSTVTDDSTNDSTIVTPEGSDEVVISAEEWQRIQQVLGQQSQAGNYPVYTFNGRTGNVVSTNGDYNASQITYGNTNLNAALANGNIKFGIDGDGNYGYIKAGADTVTPFRTGAGSTGTAGTAQVLTGYTFSNSQGTGLSGSMTNNGAVTQTLNPGGSYQIPSGYHNGNGSVSARSLNNQSKTATLSGSQQTISPDSGYDGLSGVTIPAVVGTVTANQVLSGYTFSSATNPTGTSGNITTRSASSETISSAKTYNAGYYPSAWTVTPSSGSMQATTLWTNSSPSSAFDAQYITLPVDIYYTFPFIGITIKYAMSSVETEFILTYTTFSNNNGFYLAEDGIARYFKYQSPSLRVWDAENNNNNYCIPIIVKGYKIQ